MSAHTSFVNGLHFYTPYLPTGKAMPAWQLADYLKPETAPPLATLSDPPDPILANDPRFLADSLTQLILERDWLALPAEYFRRNLATVTTDTSTPPTTPREPFDADA